MVQTAWLRIKIMDKVLYTKRFREARKHKGLTQHDLGVMLGYGLQHASAYANRYENATRIPKKDILEKICKILEITPSYLFEADETMAALILALWHQDHKERKRLLEQLAKGES